MLLAFLPMSREETTYRWNGERCEKNGVQRMPTHVSVGKWTQIIWVRLAEESEKQCWWCWRLYENYISVLEIDFRKQVDWGHQEQPEVRHNWLLNWSTWTFERKTQWIFLFFKSCEVSLEDIGPHMKDFALELNLLKKPRRMLIASFYFQRGSVITPFLQFLSSKGLVLNQVHWFIQYTRNK